MGTLMKLANTDNALADLRDACRAKTLEKQGGVLIFDEKTNTIVNHPTALDYVVVMSVIKKDKDFVYVMVPYHIGYKMTESIPKSIYPPIDYKFSQTLRDYQEQDVEEILQELNERGTSYFVAHCGYGKTVVLLYIISKLRLKTIIVCPTSSLVDQTYKVIQDLLPGIKVAIVEMQKDIPPDTQIAVCLRTRINAPMGKFKNFEFCILDEVHSLSTPAGIPGLLMMKPIKILATTATPGDRNEITEKFVGCRSIYTEKVKRWSITFPRITTGMKGSYDNIQGYTTAINELTENKNVVLSIICMALHFLSQKKRIIIIVMRTDMREKLAELFNTHAPDVKIGCIGRENRICDNCDIIIGTHKFIGTGFDESNAVREFKGDTASVLILAGSVKNETLATQIAGRVFRSDDCLVVFPYFSDIKFSENHVKEIRRYANKTRGCSVLDECALELEDVIEKSMKKFEK